MIELAKSGKLAVVILAAGKGTRMNNPDMAKVMYELNGKPMIEYVVDLATKLQAQKALVVVGWQRQSVVDHVSKAFPSVEFVDQTEQRGTGHAVMQVTDGLKEFAGDVLVLSGDVPLLAEKTVRSLVGYHRTSEASATILTVELPDPTGYGRIIRNNDGTVKKIVEQKDASKKELAVNEVNSGIYVFDKEKLFDALQHISPDNAQKEYYLTDVFEVFWKSDWPVSAVKAIDVLEVMGINDRTQLQVAADAMLDRAKA
ncbi:MAG TPA: sugar phosphate nucleotidyltransferase [Bacteroidota bacterium]|nr:sugar phosphate nucleotidyltransferase [Bacteroidota bacterium]